MDGDMPMHISLVSRNSPLFRMMQGGRQDDICKLCHLGNHGNDMNEEGSLCHGPVPTSGFRSGKFEVAEVADGHLNVIRVICQNGVGHIIGGNAAAWPAGSEIGEFKSSSLVNLFMLPPGLGYIILILIELGITAARSAGTRNETTFVVAGANKPVQG